MARPWKEHIWSWGERSLGIRSLGKGLWRLSATGERFTQHDERLAYQKFMATQPENDRGEARTMRHLNQMAYGDTNRFLHWMRELILNSPAEAAKKLGIPEIANLTALPKPIPSLTFAAIIGNFNKFNSGTVKSKREALNTLDVFLKSTGAKTLDDINNENLKTYRAKIEEKYSVQTAKAYFSRVKYIIAFGRKEGMDTEQIDRALSKLKILYTDRVDNTNNINPISREDFQTLLKADGEWEAWLLCGLNLCLHLGEVTMLEWEDFDFAAGNYWTIRNKTKKHHIPRAATLWPETMAALAKLPRKSKYVFTSTHGTHYNPTSVGNEFRDFVDRVGITSIDAKGNPLNFEWLRDGSYTVAWGD